MDLNLTIIPELFAFHYTESNAAKTDHLAVCFGRKKLHAALTL